MTPITQEELAQGRADYVANILLKCRITTEIDIGHTEPIRIHRWRGINESPNVCLCTIWLPYKIWRNASTPLFDFFTTTGETYGEAFAIALRMAHEKLVPVLQKEAK